MDPLHQLLDVQEHDTRLDQLRHRRESHPLRVELAGAEEVAAGTEARRSELGARLQELADHQARLEAEVAEAESRLAALDKRMYSGEVSAPRDLQAMADQADGLKRRRTDIEDRILQVMEEREPLDAEAARLEDEAARAGREVDRIRAALQESEGEIRAEEELAGGQRAELASGIPPDVLARYEVLRKRLGGVAVARLVNGVCGGCHLALPATELDHLRHLPADAFVACEQCGRILVHG
jgi:predicted  nucleic acid-binding Zn-ribbon protein